jgi:hypothetical protein
MKKANSPNHGGFGQNVLFDDYHVEWQPTPFCGHMRSKEGFKGFYWDNIYAPFLEKLDEKARRAVADPIVGPPVDMFDSVLLPAATPSAKDPPRPAGEHADAEADPVPPDHKPAPKPAVRAEPGQKK